MIVNVCCSASSGSTFFSNLINRHPQVVCGDELNLFSKPVFYEDYGHLKRWRALIRRFGISSNPYFPDRAILKNLESYGLSEKEAWEWVSDSENMVELVGRFKEHILKMTDKIVWAEKTPPNIFMVDKFLQFFPKDKVIHIVRDPRDVALSVLRKYSLLIGVEVWLTAVSAIERHKNHPNVLEIRYEDLILAREETLFKVCHHLNLEYNMDYFLKDVHKSRNIKKSDRWDTWGARPDGDFSAAPVGKYRKSTVDLSDLHSAWLADAYAQILGTKPYSLVELAETYGYSFDISEEGRKSKNRLLNSRLRRSLIGKAVDCVIEKNAYVDKIIY